MTPAVDPGQLVREAPRKAWAVARADFAAESGRARDRGLQQAARLVDAVVQGDTVHHHRVRRQLQAWYTRCYEASLSQSLGRREVVRPTTGEVEQLAAYIGANVGAVPGRRWPLYVAAGVYHRGLRDGARAGEAVWTALQARAVEWSRSVAPADRSDLVGQIVEQWHRRCYLAVVDEQMGLATPLRRVSEAEVQAVIQTVEAGQARRIVDRDGVPVMTAQNTRTTELDRRLDAGEAGVVPPPPPRLDSAVLRQQLEHRWESAAPRSRSSLAQDAGLSPTLADVVSRVRSLSTLDAHTQGAIRRAYLDRLSQLAGAEQPEPYRASPDDMIDSPPDRAAVEMFGLDSDRDRVEPPPAGRLRGHRRPERSPEQRFDRGIDRE